ncbi:MAG TPA: glycosyltransferase [Vicinamibacterales bacterium]|nr:glycosyltransferase [Vicinamibacterales bacterium]
MPKLSVVVVVYNIAREAPRTLFSLSAAYQRHIDSDDYEIVVVDNGSDPPFDPVSVNSLAGHFQIIRIDAAPSSPAHAVNRGLAAARGGVVGVMIDGARIVTPGLLFFALRGAHIYEKAVVACLGWYLGGDFQSQAIEAGYSHAREDALLAGIDWPRDGYRLFEIGTLDESSVDGWVASVAESNALFLRRDHWQALGGMDERFDLPGGGLVNLDTYRRAVESPGAETVLLLGEGTFHQVHGGVATNAPPASRSDNWQVWNRQYRDLQGQGYTQRPGQGLPTFLGTLPPAAFSSFVRGAIDPAMPGAQPLGSGFDRALWSTAARTAQPEDPTVAALIALAHREFREGRFGSAGAVARLGRQHAPDEWELQRLLSLTASWVDTYPPDVNRHLALAEAYRLLGETELAGSSYRAGLDLDRDLVAAHMGLSTLRMPGDLYYTWLSRFYTLLAPRTMIEIGVGSGDSLALVEPPTLAIAVDPAPTMCRPLKTEAHVFVETSDEFFARRRPDGLLAGRALDIGFIDGSHLFEESLRDFINLERYCGPRSVILMHDTVPLDEATQTRVRATTFYTGDVWRTILCLKHYRPDLDIFTIATAWSGLTVVTGLDPANRVLTDSYEQVVARFLDVPFSAIEHQTEAALNIVPNDWDDVKRRLRARKILDESMDESRA